MNSSSWEEGAGGNTWEEGSLLAFLLLLLQDAQEGNAVLFSPMLLPLLCFLKTSELCLKQTSQKTNQTTIFPPQYRNILSPENFLACLPSHF